MSTEDTRKNQAASNQADESAAAVEPEVVEAEPVDEVSALKAELDDYKDRFLRKAAEFDNFRRRTRQEKEDLFRYGAERVLKDIVAVYDDMERALSSVDEGRDDAFAQGVRLVAERLRASMNQHGVTEVPAEGEAFDPEIHEALQQVEDPSKPANTVAQVLQRGYKLHDRLLRPALVVVTKGGPQRGAEQGAGNDEGDATAS